MLVRVARRLRSSADPLDIASFVGIAWRRRFHLIVMSVKRTSEHTRVVCHLALAQRNTLIFYFVSGCILHTRTALHGAALFDCSRSST